MTAKIKLSMIWTKEIEDMWINLLGIVFCALEFLATTPYLDF
jgi:hypothetical protein